MSPSEKRPDRSAPARVCISFANVDKGRQHLDALVAHLTSLKMRKLITVWHEGEILAGSSKDAVLADELARADVLILLVSAQFLESSSILAQGRLATSRCILVPILISPCNYAGTEVDGLQMLPRNGPAVSASPNPDQVWTDIATEIEQVVVNLGRRSPPAAPAPMPEAVRAQPVPEAARAQPVPEAARAPSAPVLSTPQGPLTLEICVVGLTDQGGRVLFDGDVLRPTEQVCCFLRATTQTLHIALRIEAPDVTGTGEPRFERFRLQKGRVRRAPEPSRAWPAPPGSRQLRLTVGAAPDESRLEMLLDRPEGPPRGSGTETRGGGGVLGNGAIGSRLPHAQRMSRIDGAGDLWFTVNLSVPPAEARA